MSELVTTAELPTDRHASPGRKMTWEEFVAWLDEDIWAEWVDGEVIVMSPASLNHQTIRDWLASILSIFVRRRALGRVITAPYLVRILSRPRGREPDLIFVGQDHLSRLGDTFLTGPADLAVEIVSPESVSRDRGDKFIEYEEEGFAEYWIIDPLRRRAEFYQLDEESRYTLIQQDAGGFYHSRAVPGFQIKVEWLWQSPLPDELSVLRQLGIEQ
ncbi:MAG: Uma2 family endonuclease [Chloroflexi bacterium]|nr:Uma2 family endonuclease [Chloroflexota bacterium]MBI3762699.1 Uma2 family endonuclease [Chloroflexota bacterium]